MKPDLIIMDMDGTILDSENMLIDVWIDGGKDYGITLTKEIFIERFLGTNRTHIANQLSLLFGENFKSLEFIDYINKRQNEKLKKEAVPTKKGLFELLDHLDSLGIKKAVATSSPREKCELLLKSAKIYDRFDFIVCGDEVKNSKPDPEIFLKAANHFNVDVTKCMVFEDSRNGIIAAKKANMVPIFVPDLLKPDLHILKNSDEIIDSLDEAIKFITK